VERGHDAAVRAVLSLPRDTHHLARGTAHRVNAQPKHLGGVTRMTERLFVLAERSLGDR